jgi:cyanobactin maturation PatA/PatG family protease
MPSISSPAPEMPTVPPNPFDNRQLGDWLDKNPVHEQGLTWTLNLDATPIYAIRPAGTYAKETARVLIDIYNAIAKGAAIDVVAVPGFMIGSTSLMSGQVLPNLLPDVRGIRAWNTQQLIDLAPEGDRTPSDDLKSFLDRIYFEFRNLGVSSSDRALNYAGTNASQLTLIFSEAYRQKLVLDGVRVEKSPVCRPDSDCWDVVMTFFKPEDRFSVAKMAYRFAVDVSETLPILVGPVRRWASY